MKPWLWACAVLFSCSLVVGCGSSDEYPTEETTEEAPAPDMTGGGEAPKTPPNTFAFRLTSLKSKPGTLTNDCPALAESIVMGVRGVKSATHEGTTITVTFDPAKANAEKIAKKVGEMWDISWHQCGGCGNTSPQAAECCGKAMESKP